MFGRLVDRVAALLADEGYDADSIREELAKADVEAAIPSKSNRRIPIPHDREKYRWRNLVERLFSKPRSGAVSPPDTTKPQSPNLASSRMRQLRCDCPLSRWPKIP